MAQRSAATSARTKSVREAFERRRVAGVRGVDRSGERRATREFQGSAGGRAVCAAARKCKASRLEGPVFAVRRRSE